MGNASRHRRLEKLEVVVEQNEATEEVKFIIDPWESIFDRFRRFAEHCEKHPKKRKLLTPAEERKRAEELKQFWADLNEKLALRGLPPAFIPPE